LRQGDFCGNHRTWICKCDCGNIHKTLATNLLTEKIKSCGCLGSSYGKNNVNWKGYEEISGQYWKSLQIRAKRKSLPVSISMREAWNKFISQRKTCALSGLPLTFPKNRRERSEATASLDRIDSSKGYVPGNIQWVHKDVNTMKMDFPEKYFFGLCEKIVGHKA
jgi:hypothetical protein